VHVFSMFSVQNFFFLYHFFLSMHIISSLFLTPSPLYSFSCSSSA
jgi:hypothetical protein